MVIKVSDPESIATLAWRSLVATTTVIEGLLDAFPALRATSTNAPITTRARRIPRMVNGRVNLRPEIRGRTADPS
jgi:phage tail protein X